MAAVTNSVRFQQSAVAPLPHCVGMYVEKGGHVLHCEHAWAQVVIVFVSLCYFSYDWHLPPAASCGET